MSKPPGVGRGGARTFLGGRGAGRDPAPDPDDELFTDEELAWQDEASAEDAREAAPESWPVRRAPRPDSEVAEPYGRRRLIATAGLVVLVVVGVVLGVTLSGGGTKSPAVTTSTTAPQTTQATPPAAQAPALRVTVAKGKPLKPGQTGAAIKNLQRALKQVGFPVGKIDGSFGPKTKAAVVAFQQQHKLTADGVVGPKTAAALNAALASS